MRGDSGWESGAILTSIAWQDIMESQVWEKM